VRRLEIEFAGGAAPVEELRAVPNVRDVTVEGDHVVVAFEGSADPLVKAMARHEVGSLRSRDDDLEELFLRYYREPEGAGDAR
jgi:ABC-2 type transport system ATP-binding protein